MSLRLPEQLRSAVRRSQQVYLQELGKCIVNGCAGFIATFSALVHPIFLQSPAGSISPLTRAKIWQNVFIRGRNTAPVIAITPVVSYIYLGLSSPQASLQARLYFIAAALTVGIVPFTIFAMGPINGKLKARANSVDEDDYKRHEMGDGRPLSELISIWKWWNLTRALLPLSATILGWFAFSHA